MNKPLIRYNLQFFAKEGPGGEKTEDATSKKLKDARNDGQVGKSQELSHAIVLMGLFVGLKIFVGFIGTKFLSNFQNAYDFIPEMSDGVFTVPKAYVLFEYGVLQIIITALPLFLIAFALSFIGNVFQFKWQVTAKPLQPKFSKFNPVSGFKRLFSKDKIMELLKSILKIVVIGYVVYDTLKDKYPIILSLYDISLNSAIALIGDIIINLGITISSYFIVIGLIDFIYQKRKFKTDMKMTKQEVKDEYKNSEGDPHIKGQIKQRMREASQRRMMQDLPKADVVITNPTHFAVAIRYDADNFSAPIVIAKGADYIAFKIKEVAKENRIEIVENKPLARMLYFNVDIGAEIPPELYQTVAEVLAYVYGLKNKL